MPDITMCNAWLPQEDRKCPMKDTCYRHTAKPNPLWQSYFTQAPAVFVHDSISCEYYWSLEKGEKV